MIKFSLHKVDNEQSNNQHDDNNEELSLTDIIIEGATKILSEVLSFLLCCLVIMSLWNYCAADLTSLPILTYWQVVGLKLLFNFFTRE